MGPNTKYALELIREERIRQTDELGFTPEVNKQEVNGELAVAAAWYALTDQGRVNVAKALQETGIFSPTLWPWSPESFKPGNRLRELSKAGALIAAELERLWSIRHDHIVDVVPIDLHDQCNWDDWQAAFVEAGIADGWENVDSLRNDTDWKAARADYFDEGMSAIEAYKSFYYEDYA